MFFLIDFRTVCSLTLAANLVRVVIAWLVVLLFISLALRVAEVAVSAFADKTVTIFPLWLFIVAESESIEHTGGLVSALI